MKETAKCQAMREARGDFNAYLHGNGIDIGCGDDVLRVKNGLVLGWDKQQGDASLLQGIADGSRDFVYSSHCLEHLVDVHIAVKNWARVLKPGGFMYVAVPDYFYYEKCRWPSVFNTDHKQSFSLELTREKVNRRNHWNIRADLGPVLYGLSMKLIISSLELDGYDWNNGHLDQTTRGALSQICFVAVKGANTLPPKA